MPGQMAIIVASAQNWEKAQPAHRPEKAGQVAGLPTVADRAALSGARERTQQSADKFARADPDLALKVAHGERPLKPLTDALYPRQIEASLKGQDNDQIRDS